MVWSRSVRIGLLVFLAVGAEALAPARAHAAAAHDLQVRLAHSGLSVLERAVPSLFGGHTRLPDFHADIGCVHINQASTDLEVRLEAVRVTPRDGALAIDITFSATADGRLFADRAIACLTNVICNDHVEVQSARLTVLAHPAVRDGRVTAEFRNLNVELDPARVKVEITGCTLGPLLNTAISFLQHRYGRELMNAISRALEERLAPALGNLVGGLPLEIGNGRFQLALVPGALTVTPAALLFSGGAQVITSLPRAACVRGDDLGSPRPRLGAAPNLDAGPTSDIGLSINLGLLEEALYQAWRGGLLCLQSGANGVRVDLSIFEFLLPGIPPGSRLSMALRCDAPPRLLWASGERLRVRFPEVDFDLHAHLPSKGTRSFQADLDVELEASVVLDPVQNALVARVERIDIASFRVVDPFLSASQGFDPAFVLDRLERVIIPGVVAQFGSPRVAALGAQFGGLALILRRLEFTASHLATRLDLFAMPRTDRNAPDTHVELRPLGMVSAEKAQVVVSGTDAEVPLELLRYSVAIDGRTQAVSPFRQIQVGVPERSGTYRVTVAAVDPAGNIDATPIEIVVNVDGRPPELALASRAVRRLGVGETLSLSFSARDDRTPADALYGRLRALRLPDPRDQVAAEETAMVDVRAGERSAELTFAEAGIYRVELDLYDQVGNRGIASILVRVGADDGCASASSTSSGLGPPLAVFALAFTLTRTRRQRRRRNTIRG